MDMTGEQRIAASREIVWAALNDPEVLKQCIPGCKSLEKSSDTEMKATATIAVGPVKANFAGTVLLSEIDAPNSYVIRGEGSGGVAGFAKGQAHVTLSDVDDGTLLAYTVKADVGGKLAQLGSRLIDSTARKLAGEFFAAFGNAVAPPEPAATPEAAEIEATAKKKGWFRKWLGQSPKDDAGA